MRLPESVWYQRLQGDHIALVQYVNDAYRYQIYDLRIVNFQGEYGLHRRLVEGSEPTLAQAKQKVFTWTEEVRS